MVAHRQDIDSDFAEPPTPSSMIDYSDYDDPHELEETRAKEARNGRDAAHEALLLDAHARFAKAVNTLVRPRLEEIAGDLRARGFWCEVSLARGVLRLELRP